MKPPKNIEKYDSSTLAGMKLVQLALEHVFGCKDGVKVRWSLTLSYWNDDWVDPEKTKDMKVIPRTATFSNS